MYAHIKHFAYLILISPLLFYSCVGDDIIDDEVDRVLKITNPIDTLAFDSSYQFTLMYLNNVGREEQAEMVAWTSSEPSIISIDDSGLAHGLQTGAAIIKAETVVEGVEVTDEIFVHVGEETIIAASAREGTLKTTSSYKLDGSFSLSEVEGDLVLAFEDDYSTSDRLPGLYLYLTNNPNTTAGAMEIGEVTIFSGAHSYTLPAGTGLNDYSHVLYFCKPFNVKVGDGAFDN